MKQIRVCKSGACSSFGAKRIMEEISTQTGVAPGEKNDTYDLGYCGCFGWCAKAPCVETDGEKIIFSCEPETIMQKINDNEGVLMEEKEIDISIDPLTSV
ncbi:MAG: hypothetical protein HOL80_04240 [Candidatus Magasanikbacteria bacterium]|jgi:NADH:ubiquinone oxidoreductase subunit E|nr:hypothetical protein [Candidatus Magasanikbacteria bacterium]MBT5263072.1 hypothetical protein [Candidatus Magasanikbacteria bacterium]MBT5819885.1 hypothetical protein [Candidatus Magasanikbacteria bacterium]MBT6294257.1 hypothetical protein [Candidatus Magasanikbacteria bacterium]